MAKRKKKTRSKKIRLTAAAADRHSLYEASVQDPDEDIRFISRVFKKERGTLPLTLREDFCGTAVLCARWADSHKERTCVGLDLHQPTMNWGKKKHIAPLKEDVAARVKLLKANVMEGAGAKFDVTVAFNFSYCALKERSDMLRYFRNVHKETRPTGAFFLDIHGGTEVFEEMEEETDHDDFTYVWDQEPFDAIRGYAMRHIHFRFADGTALNKAFTYDWRLWHLTELRDVLLEAGFARVDVYWEGAHADGTGNGIFRKRQSAENELSWIAYIVAWKKA